MAQFYPSSSQLRAGHLMSSKINNNNKYEYNNKLILRIYNKYFHMRIANNYIRIIQLKAVFKRNLKKVRFESSLKRCKALNTSDLRQKTLP